MDDAKQELVELIEAFAAARATQNRLLQTWAAQGLSSYINALQISPREEHAAAAPGESASGADPEAACEARPVEQTTEEQPDRPVSRGKR